MNILIGFLALFGGTAFILWLCLGRVGNPKPTTLRQVPPGYGHREVRP